MAKPPGVAKRGVYLAPFTENGDRHYYSVTSTGERLRVIPVPIGADPTDAIDVLWLQLERKDPQPSHGDGGDSSPSVSILA